MKKYLNDNSQFLSQCDMMDDLTLWSAPFGLKLLEKVIIRPKLTALDIGFGMGFPLTEIAMRAGADAKIYGVDIWLAGIERTQKKISHYEIKNVELFNCPAEKLPLDDSSTDLITGNNAINNVADMDTVLRECGRVAKPGAQMVMTMNLDKTFIEFYSVMQAVLTERGMFAEIEKMHKHIYLKRRPAEEVIESIEKAGFGIHEKEFCTFEYRFADAGAMLNHYFFRVAFIDSWAELIEPHQTESIFDEIESRLNIIAAEKGCLTMTVPFVVIDARRNS